MYVVHGLWGFYGNIKYPFHIVRVQVLQVHLLFFPICITGFEKCPKNLPRKNCLTLILPKSEFCPHLQLLVMIVWISYPLLSVTHLYRNVTDYCLNVAILSVKMMQ